MTLKRWVLGKVNRTVDPRGRVAPTLTGEADVRERSAVPGMREMGVRRESLRETAHLGRYAPLVLAIREELEQFVANELRLHLAIAERDRFVLTSIEVDCEDSEEHRELLRHFMREFKPEQIKQYLARDVIAGLRNASAIDLTQFAGLNASQQAEAVEEEDDGYAELVAQLQSQTPPDDGARPYEVRLLGRWSEAQGVRGARELHVESHAATMPHTPLAARSVTFAVTDASGRRSLELAAVPGRRYSLGKDETCDIVVNGTYASRRHCEIWFDRDRWWVADAGSTNGIRVESNGAMQRRNAGASGRAEAIELGAGGCIVLSAHGEGDASRYPRIELAADAADEQRAEPVTLVTPIAPSRRAPSPWSITAQMASGARDADIADTTLPFHIGRSRNQALVIDWAHADVSGRHVEIVALGDAGASVLVHGDNGVTLAGTTYAAGAQFWWKPGEEMVLGHADADGPRCRLLLSHRETTSSAAGVARSPRTAA